MNRKITKLMLLAGIGVTGWMTPRAAADEWDQKTILTFNTPVEIPGRVLEPGTYVFKLLASLSDRNIVQVFSQDEKHIYGTFLTIPDERLKPADKTTVTFAERAAGSPEAIKAWFYPGQLYGHDFVYPKQKAVELARTNGEPVPAIPESVAKPVITDDAPQLEAMSTVPLVAETPEEEEIEIAEFFVVTETTESEEQELPAELPHTASTIPLTGVLGLILLGIAGFIAIPGRLR
jgi:hypothetical protein